jgi:FKBP-type peptidyl-prolyl cis-trans isomerase 2
MLAWTDPQRTLDTPRLSALSAKPENAHGASNADRNQRVARQQFHGMGRVNQSQ